jgi:hypothetical protein
MPSHHFSYILIVDSALVNRSRRPHLAVGNLPRDLHCQAASSRGGSEDQAAKPCLRMPSVLERRMGKLRTSWRDNYQAWYYREFALPRPWRLFERSISVGDEVAGGGIIISEFSFT